ncbi:NADH-quinone oxidoreductase subunit NuoE [uncultured Microbulbifer sp.]|uniref:NADH-quinone oxidoreductase subunit NuoE n=1 Tax=uncultured Microbulbifer sp. TaxID=348147 RepID=UPI0025CF2A31|nr:NADH-quinone oxidoreductase subunit NuoE [uncultured Microbulbifer sp.]
MKIANTSEFLSAEEIAEIEREFEIYPTRRAAGLEALRIVQKHRGWVSDEALQALAAFLQVDTAELESLATYYQLIFRRPVGKAVVYCCNSASCWLMGSRDLQRQLQTRLQVRPGQTTDDGKITLLETPCLGDCDQAPVIMVGTAGGTYEMHRRLTTEKLEELVNDLQKVYGGSSDEP